MILVIGNEKFNGSGRLREDWRRGQYVDRQEGLEDHYNGFFHLGGVEYLDWITCRVGTGTSCALEDVELYSWLHRTLSEVKIKNFSRY